jgi:D-glycero-alpha-D-manno-heptose-7-phosphate kinase
LRLGLAGGGTDVSPYSDIYGGSILNATINMFAYSAIEPRDDGKIVFNAIDRNLIMEFDSAPSLQTDGQLDLMKGVYNRIVADYSHEPLSFTLSTYVDAPPGSGLGSSSTLVVALIGAFVEWLKIPLGEYDIAHLAYQVEREDLKLSGGKQDQYAAAFGGFNLMEFYENNKVIVNPLRLRERYINELEMTLLLYYTGTSRLSSKIIEAQSSNVLQKLEKPIDAMHKLKEQTVMMKEAILKGEFHRIGDILNFGWKFKKQMAEEISNPVIDEIYEAAMKAGSTGGKISGAGGGGFMMFYCPGNSRFNVMETLKKFGGELHRFQFAHQGLTTWTV